MLSIIIWIFPLLQLQAFFYPETYANNRRVHHPLNIPLAQRVIPLSDEESIHTSSLYACNWVCTKPEPLFTLKDCLLSHSSIWNLWTLLLHHTLSARQTLSIQFQSHPHPVLVSWRVFKVWLNSWSLHRNCNTMHRHIWVVKWCHSRNTPCLWC